MSSHFLYSSLFLRRIRLVSFLCVLNPQVVGVTALACGMIAVGTCNGDVTSTIVQTIMEKNEQELKDTYARWLPLGLGLNHLGMHLRRTLRNCAFYFPKFDNFF